MIFDFLRKKDTELNVLPKSGKAVHIESSDSQELDVSRGLTPAKLDKIMSAANSGDISAQCRLSFEVEEKNSDIAHALSTRRNAVLGVKRSIEPGGESEADKKAAEAFSVAMDSINGNNVDTLDELLNDLTTFLLPTLRPPKSFGVAVAVLPGFLLLSQNTLRYHR